MPADRAPMRVQRARAAFYPFVRAFQLPINPDDVDEILHAVLLYANSDADPDAIATAVDEQLADYLRQHPHR